MAIVALTITPLLADLSSIRNLIRNGRFSEAIAECEFDLKAAPRAFTLLTLKGLALQGSGDRVAALAAFKQALAFNPSYEPALQAAAQIEFDNKDPNAAKTLESILRLNPASETAHALLGALLFERRQCEAAILHFEKAPGALASPAIKWPYGVCLLTRERWLEAAAQFSALLKLREHAPTRYNLALAYWNAGDYKASAATLDGRATGGAGAARLLASALDLSGDTPKAFAVLQAAIQADPRDERLLIDLAVMCMDHKAFDVGLEVVEAGIRASPDSARLQTLLGVLLARGGDIDKGQAAFRRARELAPESGLGRIGLASMLMQMGLAADAARVLREQLAQGGPDPKAELTLARALLLKDPSPEEAREAAALLRRVVKQEPANATAHGLLGKAELQLGNDAAAAAGFGLAIRLDPADRTSTYQLMKLYRRTGRSREAAELGRKVQALLDKERTDEAAESRFRIVRDSR